MILFKEFQQVQDFLSILKGNEIFVFQKPFLVTAHGRSFLSNVVFYMALIQTREIATCTQMKRAYKMQLSQPHLPLVNAIIVKALRDEPRPRCSAGFSGDLPRGRRCRLYFYGLELFGGLCKMHCSQLSPQSILSNSMPGCAGDIWHKN